MKNKTVTLSGVFCVLISNTRTISTVKEIKPSPYTPDLVAQRRSRHVWSIIVSMWTVKKSPPSVKAQTTQKVEITRLLSDSILTPYDRMVTCHAVIFVFLRCHHALWRRSAAFKGLPRCRSPPYPPKIWNPAHHQIFGGSAMHYSTLHIIFTKNFFNSYTSCSGYSLSFATESNEGGVNVWPRPNADRNYSGTSSRS